MGVVSDLKHHSRWLAALLLLVAISAPFIIRSPREPEAGEAVNVEPAAELAPASNRAAVADTATSESGVDGEIAPYPAEAALAAVPQEEVTALESWRFPPTDVYMQGGWYHKDPKCSRITDDIPLTPMYKTMAMKAGLDACWVCIPQEERGEDADAPDADVSGFAQPEPSPEQ